MRKESVPTNCRRAWKSSLPSAVAPICEKSVLYLSPVRLNLFCSSRATTSSSAPSRTLLWSLSASLKRIHTFFIHMGPGWWPAHCGLPCFQPGPPCFQPGPPCFQPGSPCFQWPFAIPGPNFGWPCAAPSLPSSSSLSSFWLPSQSANPNFCCKDSVNVSRLAPGSSASTPSPRSCSPAPSSSRSSRPSSTSLSENSSLLLAILPRLGSMLP
mmetsp:Transcript_10617/g.31177  ORF Transcript_10617/g.31177 Transcript_10617/m.31177 type:complete len:212 (+) Transcript_10617:1196-1831(+)